MIDSANGRQQIEIGNVNVSEPHRHIIFMVHQNKPNSKIDVYVDCYIRGEIPLNMTFREVMEQGLEDSSFEVVMNQSVKLIT